MYSGAISGVDMMSNGHMLVTHGTQGTLYEVATSDNIVWKFINPIGASGTFTQGEEVPEGNRAGTTANPIFKAKHISIEHPALAARTLTHGHYLEHWEDVCPTEDAWGWDRDGDGCIDDTDDDGVTDPNDACPAGDDGIDVDFDGMPDACDDVVDRDQDGVPDGEDRCDGYDDHEDVDNDSLPDGCDDLVDSDRDGVADNTDRCQGHDDAVDVDGDSVPDGCDGPIDSDDDGVADFADVCPGHDDTVDLDEDGVPDGCDDPSEASNTTLETQKEQPQNETLQDDTASSSIVSLRSLATLLGLAICGTAAFILFARNKA